MSSPDLQTSLFVDEAMEVASKSMGPKYLHQPHSDYTAADISPYSDCTYHLQPVLIKLYLLLLLLNVFLLFLHIL